MKDDKAHRVLRHKRNQLRIDDNAQQDWSDMKAILDMQMPVPTPGAAAGGSSAAGLSGLAGIKIVSIILAALSVVASLTYFALKNNHINHHTDQKTVKAIKHDRAGSAPATINSSQQYLVNDSTTNRVPGGNGINPTVSSNSDAKPVSSVAPSKEHGATNSNAAAATGGVVSSDKRNTLLADHKNNRAINSTGATTTGGAVSPGKHNTLSPDHKNNRAINSTGATTTGGAVSSGKHNTLSPDPKNHRAINSTGATATGRVVSSGKRNTFSHVRGGPGSGRFNSVGNNMVRLHHRASGHSVTTYAHTGHSIGRPRNASGLSANTKLKGGHRPRNGITSGYVKNSGANNTVHAGVTGLAPGDATQSTSGIAGRYNELGGPAHIGFIAPRYSIPTLPGYLTGLFKEPYNMPADTPGRDFAFHLIVGVNPSGSFTARNQNINFYGRFPVDVFFGLTGSYNFSDQWGASIGIRALTPRNISGSYTHKNDSKIDTLQTLNISDSRKLYFLDFPVNLIFKPSSDFNIKAGMVFSIPVQEANGNSTFQTGKLKKDTLYYNNVNQLINKATYTGGLIFSVSAGVGYEHGRFNFDASYVRDLNLVPITSPLGGYKAGSNEFLFTVGFRLNKLKK